MAKTIQKLLFVDTNIWLDFYRARKDAGLKLLTHVEAVADRIIVTYQLESEFKKNRQTAIMEGMQELKAPSQIPRPGIFSHAKATQILGKNLKEAEKRVKSLKTRLARALEKPATHDPVYKAGCWAATEQKTAIRLLKQHRRVRPTGSAVAAVLLFAQNPEPRTRIVQVD